MIVRFPILLAFSVTVLVIYGLLAPPQLPPLTASIDRILIDKSERTMTLFQDDRPVRRYPVSLGFSPSGDKIRQGDGKTPEGVFRIDRRNPQSRFHLSLGIDYPQPDDLERASAGGYDAGGEIFIHGQPRGIMGNLGIPTDWTAGCIAVTNDTMDILWRVAPTGTVVEIRP